jgi:hypothetical protein
MGNPCFRNYRIVLFPHGPVQSTNKEHFYKMLFACDANISRFWEQDFSQAAGDVLEHYIRYIKRARLEKSPEFSESIVLLTRDNPPALKIVAARRRLEEAFPALRTALWAVCIDLQANPFIINNLHGLGVLRDETFAAPIFVDRSGLPYLLLKSDCNNMIQLRMQAQVIKNPINNFPEKELSTVSRRRNAGISGSGTYSFLSEPPPSTKRGY